MLGKMEMRTPPGSRPRDGRHCDLCGCSQPAVRCDKCGCQIFCLSCDDMYHRHPKRRFHLRKTVDPTPPVPQARPVLPVKVSQLPTSNPGDPSKMPLPPPRKKKSLFGSFRKPSSSDNSPPLPKKEYSWSNRLGSIKKFMSNRPLPPLPNADDNDMETEPSTNGQSAPGDLSFIHRRSDERPPQLPQRSPKSPDFSGTNQESENRFPNSSAHMPGQIRNGSLEPNTNHMNQNREFPNNEENQWNNMMNNRNESQKFGTLNRHQRGVMPPGAPAYPLRMHLSSSATDLHNLQNHDGMPGAGQVPPHFPHYPMNPHMPPHYPYPMYPQYPNYPQYFGNSFVNLSNPPTSEDFSDNSESASRHSSKRHPFRKRAKRSQSVMMDRMAYPGQFYPFGPYPGFGPWGAPMPMEAPPSPASSVRSLNRSGRNRRRKKMTSEDDDEELSVSSSPLSRPKSSSSDPKETPRAPLATQTTSSDDESDGDRNNRRNKSNTIQKRQFEPIRSPSPASEPKIITKLKKSSSKQSDSDTPEISESRTERKGSRDSASEKPIQQQSSSSPDMWECKHCTYVNPAGNRICQVCCKTATPRTETPVTTQSRPASAAGNSRKPSVDSEKGCSSPEKHPETEDDTSKKERQDMASLNSALDEAEKQISKGLEELMKLKDDIDSNMSKEKSKTAETQSNTESTEASKPVYKSSGRMRTSILDKLNLNKAQTSTASASTSTDTQTGPNNWTSDKIIEARRHSNSSTTSETYNSPIAQSPELGRAFLGNRQKRDSSCQTQQDSLADFLERKKASEEAFLGRPVNNFGFGYNDRMDMMTSPVPSMYDRYFGGGYGMMQRSHSRASLFTGRMNDLGPMEYGGGFGYGPTPMYRSVSRGSLTGDYPDGRGSDFHNLRKPDFYLSMEELVERRRQENIRSQGLELVRMIREAEQQGFNADDIQVALSHCGKQNPLEWLQENWRNMVDSVVTLSTNYGNDKKENDIGLLSENEARDSLRLHKGNIWAAVTECVEGRQRKYLELGARGNFSRKDIVDALTSSEGEVEMAYAKLSKSAGKPFLMRIWGAGEGVQNQDGARPLPEELNEFRQRTLKDETLNSDDLSEEIWSEEGDWDEDEDEFEERGEFEDLQTCREDLNSGPQEIKTPESDKSDYCDAFPVDDRNASSPSDDIFFVIPEAKPEKKKGFLSKLAAFRRDSKEQADTISKINKDELIPEQRDPCKEDSVSQNSSSSSEQPKNNGALSALKNTLSAIKDTVTGGTKNDKKVPCAQLEKRTIIVKGQLDHESLSGSSKNNVTLTSVKPLENDSIPMFVTEKESSENNKQSPKFESKEVRTDNYIKEEVNKQDVDCKLSNVEQKDNIQKQSDKENIFKPIEPEIKEETKKPQSLAERLKFAKQTRLGPSTSKSSTVEKLSSLQDIVVPDTTDTKNISNNLPLNQENVTPRYTDEEIKRKLNDDKQQEAYCKAESDNNLRNAVLEVTRTSASPAEQNIKKETGVPKDIPFVKSNKISIDVTKNEATDPKLTNKPSLLESITSHDNSIEIKPFNEVKLIDKIQYKKTEDNHYKKEVVGKIPESISNQQDLTSLENLNAAETNNSYENEDPGKNDTRLQTDSIDKLDTSKNISDSSAVKQVTETIIGKTTAEDDTDIQIANSPSTSINTAEAEKDSEINAESVSNAVSKMEINTLKKEISKNTLEKFKAESDSSNTIAYEILTTDIPKALSNELSKSESKVEITGSIKESDEIQEKISMETKDQTISNIQSLKDVTVISKTTLVEDNLPCSRDTTTDSTEGGTNSVEGPDKYDSHSILTEGNIAFIENENETAEKGQGSKIEQSAEKISRSDAPKTQEAISNAVSTSHIAEQKVNLQTTPLVKNISEMNVGKLSEGNMKIIQESNINIAEEINISANPSGIPIPTKMTVEQNLDDNIEEKTTTCTKTDSAKYSGQEITKNKDDAKYLQNTKDTSKNSQKEEVSRVEEIEKSPTVLNSSLSKSINDDNKLGKFKFSKSGKVKKTQMKDDKKDCIIDDKTQTKTATSIPSSINQSSTVLGISDDKSSIRVDDVNLKGKTSSSHTTADVLIDSKSFSEKTSNDTETEKPIKSSNEITEAKSNISPKENDLALSEKNKPQYLDQENESSKLEIISENSSNSINTGVIPSNPNLPIIISNAGAASKDDFERDKKQEVSETSETGIEAVASTEVSSRSTNNIEKTVSDGVEFQDPVVSKEFPGNKNSLIIDSPSSSNSQIPDNSNIAVALTSKVPNAVVQDTIRDYNSAPVEIQTEQHSKIQNGNITENSSSVSDKTTSPESSVLPSESTSLIRTGSEDHSASQNNDSDDTDDQYSDESRPSSVTPPSPVDALRNRFEGLAAGGSVRPQSPFRRMSFNSRKEVILLEKKRNTTEKPWFHQKTVREPVKITLPKRSIKQQLEMERKVRKMVADRKCRTYRKAEIVVQLMDMNFEEEESILAANECSTLERAISYLQQECLLCAGYFPVSQIVSMTHCQHRACTECIRAYFTVQIRDRTILDLLCPFCNEPDIRDEDVAQDYFNHLDIMLKKLVDLEIHELFQRKLRDRVLMKDPNFRWCSQCSSGFIAMPNLKRLVCPDCNAVTCALCRRLWEREHQGISCEAFAALKGASDPEAQAAGLAKLLTEDGIDCPSCHFRYALAKGGCMHFRCIQCQHDFCSGCSRPFKMGQKCGVSEFCAKLGLHAHHPRNCLFYLRDKEPEDLQKLLDMNDIKYNKELPDNMQPNTTCQVMEQKETADGMMDDYCGKEVQEGYAGLCRIHYVEYLGQLVNKHKVDPIQIFENDDLELVLRRANIRLPPKRYRENDAQYREKLVKLIQEDLPLDKMDGS